jgi:hypothetical protein
LSGSPPRAKQRVHQTGSSSAQITPNTKTAISWYWQIARIVLLVLLRLAQVLKTPVSGLLEPA